MDFLEIRKRIFDGLAANEEAIGALYKVYAEMFPRYGRFFTGLAGEEAGHANWVRELAKTAAEVALKIDAERFNLAALDKSLKEIDSLKQAAEDADFSVKKALQTALKLEEEMLEAKYFEVIKDDEVILADLLRKLERATLVHRDKIRLVIDNFDKGL
jgi:hypothetical protein